MNFPGSLAWSASATLRFQTVAGDLRGHQRLDRRPGDQRVDGVQRDPLHLFLGPGLQDQGLRRGDLADRGARLVRQVDHARVLGVVGDARPVERRVDLHLVAEGMLDRLALEVLVRVAGRGEDVPDGERVERPARVDVRFAEVGVALRARGLCARLCGPEADGCDRNESQRARVVTQLHGMSSWIRPERNRKQHAARPRGCACDFVPGGGGSRHGRSVSCRAGRATPRFRRHPP